MTSAQIGISVTIIVYLLAMLGVGIACSKKNNDTDDFYLGGRKLGPLVTAMSAEASDMSSWLLMGLPGLAYLTGIADAGWTAIGLAIGTYVNWLIVAKRIRLYSIPQTIPSPFQTFFTTVFGIERCTHEPVCSGHSNLFRSLYGIGLCCLRKAVFQSVRCRLFLGNGDFCHHHCGIYRATGGFLAASTTDFIQSIIMSVALIVVLGFGIYTAGGLDAVMDNARALPGYFSMSLTHNPQTGTAAAYGMLNRVSMLCWGLGYFGMPHILLRFMAIEDEKKLGLSRRIASVWVVISLIIGVFIGVVGLAMTAAGELPALTGADSETIIVRIADLLSRNGIFFAVLAGLILAGILASTMSTADSQLLAASSSVSENLIQGVLGHQMNAKQSMYTARAALLFIAVIGVFLARDPNSSVFAIVSFAWAGFGAAFGPVVMFALFWRRTNRYGAIAGMLTGGVMVFVWKYWVRPLGGLWNIYELMPAFAAACLAIWVVSLMTPAPEQEILDEFDRVKALDSQR